MSTIFFDLFSVLFVRENLLVLSTYNLTFIDDIPITYKSLNLIKIWRNNSSKLLYLICVYKLSLLFFHPRENQEELEARLLEQVTERLLVSERQLKEELSRKVYLESNYAYPPHNLT